jgi:hypothetical protein
MAINDLNRGDWGCRKLSEQKTVAHQRQQIDAMRCKALPDADSHALASGDKLHARKSSTPLDLARAVAPRAISVCDAR